MKRYISGRLKHIIIAIHALILISLYLYFRSSLVIPLWEKYLHDAWAALGIISVILLFLKQKLGKRLAIAFYCIIALWLFSFAFDVRNFELTSIKEYLLIFVEFLWLAIILCFPIVLLFEIKPEHS